MNSQVAPEHLTERQGTLFSVLQGSDRELSGQDLHAKLRDSRQGMGLATVYRHLRHLQQLGLVRCRHLPSGEALYAPTERDTHHLTCVSCGLTVTLERCPMHGAQPRGEDLQGFELLFHTLEFFGLCSGCRQRQLSH